MGNIFNIEIACLEIAYDNGMIHRHCPWVEVLGNMLSNIKSKFTETELAAVEQELAILSYDDLVLVCTDPLFGPDISDLADDVLNTAFES